MRKLNQNGNAALVIALCITGVLLLGSVVFGVWAYSESQKYKKDTDQIVAQQVKIAVDRNSTAKDNQFAEQLKSPVKTYNGPSTYGSIALKYPKTWSAYIDSSSQSSQPINGYFSPNFVPGIQSGQAFALRVQVTSNGYNQELDILDGQVQAHQISVKPYSLPKVKGVVGVKVVGQLTQSVRGTMIVMPLRDKALKVWTESKDYQKDFDKYILPNLQFSP